MDTLTLFEVLTNHTHHPHHLGGDGELRTVEVDKA